MIRTTQYKTTANLLQGEKIRSLIAWLILSKEAINGIEWHTHTLKPFSLLMNCLSYALDVSYLTIQQPGSVALVVERLLAAALLPIMVKITVEIFVARFASGDEEKESMIDMDDSWNYMIGLPIEAPSFAAYLVNGFRCDFECLSLNLVDMGVSFDAWCEADWGLSTEFIIKVKPQGWSTGSQFNVLQRPHPPLIAQQYYQHLFSCTCPECVHDYF